MAPAREAGNLQRVFLTGATGFLGMALAERLTAQGAQVVGLHRAGSPPAAVRWLEERGVQLVCGDLEHQPPVAGGLAAAFAGCDLVIHCAAVIGYRRRLAGRMARSNVLGTRQVVEACLAARVGRLLHVSSIAAVGISDRPVLLDEESEWTAGALHAAYFDTKREAEAEVQAGIAAGLDAVIVNPAAIWGASLVPSNSSRVLQRILDGAVRFVPPGGMNIVPLATVVDGCLLAARLGRCGRRYILGGENLSLEALVTRVGRVAGRPLRARVLPAALGRPLRALLELLEPWVPDGVWFPPDMLAVFGRWMWFDCGRSQRELGLPPADLDACLREAISAPRR